MEAGSENKESSSSSPPSDAKMSNESSSDDKKSSPRSSDDDESVADKTSPETTPPKKKKKPPPTKRAAAERSKNKLKESAEKLKESEARNNNNNNNNNNLSTPPKKRGKKNLNPEVEPEKMAKLAKRMKGDDSSAKEEVATDNGKTAESKYSSDGIVPMVEDPNLPDGWKRKVVQRQTGRSAGHFDVYIYSPEGKKFRSRFELANYFADNNSKLNVDDFDFSIKGRANSKTKLKPTVTRKTLTKPSSSNTEKATKNKRGAPSKRLIVNMKFKRASKSSSPIKPKPSPKSSTNARSKAKSRKNISPTNKGTKKRP